MTPREDLQWQRFFAACALPFVVFTFVGLQVFWPQPMSFALSAEQTAAFYVEHKTGFLLGVIACSIGMAFLLIWTIQLGLMLFRLEGNSRVVSLVTAVSLAASPILLSFDLAIFGVAAYRPDDVDPDITRMLSDIAWLGSQHIWPMLTVGMALTGVLILKTRDQPGAFPGWLGYFSLFVALGEFGQIGVFFFKTGPISGNGIAAWYLATFTWGAWILAAGWVMWRMLGQQSVRADSPDPIPAGPPTSNVC